jgi:hypothetical protein
MSIQGLCFSEQVHFSFHRKIISLLHIPFVAVGGAQEEPKGAALSR